MKQVCDQNRGFRSPDPKARIAESFSNPEALHIHNQYCSRLYTPKNVGKEIRKIIDFCDKNSIPRAIISDHPCLDKLEAIGLKKGWSSVVSCRSYGALKPLPDALHAVVAQIGVPHHQLLMIGDRWDTDGLMATKAGVPFVHIKNIDNVLQRIRCKT